MDVCNASLPQHLPDLVLDIIFSNLKLSDLYSCMLVCRNWNRAINDGSSEPWKSICRRELTKEFLESDHLSPLKSHKDKIRALCHSWNPDDCSKNIVVENRGFTFVRNLIAESTDMVRTKIGYNTGKHTWEITWIEPLGTVAMIGVSTKDAPLRCDGYEQLLGANKYSWGWNLVGNTLVHNAIPHESSLLFNITILLMALFLTLFSFINILVFIILHH
ncbi:F-box/SPRY domain-containing protein 1-like isoform X2 [Acyrthosiphon pisum]|uniref:F-box domain-containing protein n=1 Tax=Acyrthosiphon pisum TaxID=7029 RepID=A0A8R2D2M5_ACYPI|nr:F-box/SPRY domain-containing protein 1-like isoform X2 [Acyrthosiphon pisum]|eukprot:XP_016656903.1 PREDICTED: F-box/SPRY domain-containing protein 1-like isoform X2 [Acyrthosiphon pisum]